MVAKVIICPHHKMAWMVWTEGPTSQIYILGHVQHIRGMRHAHVYVELSRRKHCGQRAIVSDSVVRAWRACCIESRKARCISCRSRVIVAASECELARIHLSPNSHVSLVATSALEFFVTYLLRSLRTAHTHVFDPRCHHLL
jgi:hypothetical protein